MLCLLDTFFPPTLPHFLKTSPNPCPAALPGQGSTWWWSRLWVRTDCCDALLKPWRHPRSLNCPQGHPSLVLKNSFALTGSCKIQEVQQSFHPLQFKLGVPAGEMVRSVVHIHTDFLTKWSVNHTHGVLFQTLLSHFFCNMDRLRNFHIFKFWFLSFNSSILDLFLSFCILL